MYVSRCQMILQKGLFVADICFPGLSRQKDPPCPQATRLIYAIQKNFYSGLM